MKKTMSFLSILFLLIPSFVFAAETNLKIGVIDGEQILRVAPQVAEINKSLEKQFRPEHDKLVKDQQTVQAQIEKLNRDGATMTEKERSVLQDKIIAERTRLRSKEESFQQNLNKAQTDAMTKFTNQVKAAVEKLATEQKYDFVFLKQAVIYSGSQADVTDPVLKKLK